MITQFSVKNYKSIKDEICLDMSAASIHENEASLIEQNGERYLPVSVIYGPNAGGKSNIIDSLKVLVNMVVRPSLMQGGGNITYVENLEVVPYGLSEENREQPTEYELYFTAGVYEYKYCIAFKSKTVVYEYLYFRNPRTNRINAVFERDNGQIVMKGEFQKLKIVSDLSDEMPLLSYLGLMYSNNPVIGGAWKWFRYGIIVARTETVNLVYPFSAGFDRNSGMKARTLAMLKALDIDIDDFHVDRNASGVDEVITVHSMDGYKMELRLDEESTGTRKLFCLIPLFILNLMQGGTVVIDELDAQIHPKLLEYFIQLFTTPSINRNGAQLIFSSHDLATMRNDIFRRDEIWFAAKGCHQNTGLYSLAEFKTENGECPRANDSFMKSYLKGKYGADPYLQKIISWEDVEIDR